MIYLIIFIITVILLLIIKEYIKLDITTFNITDKKIDKNLKIMLLSDLHDRNIKNKLDEKIKKIKPDIIILSGDMVNKYKENKSGFIKTIPIFKNYKTYYTFGNHEELMDYKDKYTEKINKTDLILLNNKKEDLTKNIKLYGINVEGEYFYINRPKVNKDYVLNKLGEIDNKKYNILISHSPLFEYVKENTEYDLILSGHVHGGLFMIPGIGGVLSPEFKLFPKYYNGLYNINNTKLIVSRGLGFSSRIPIRILNTPQIVVINLMKNK